LLPCPFCGRPVDENLEDTLYPSGVYWRFDPKIQRRTYHSRREQQPGDHDCMEMNCTETNGGCGARITADSEEEVIAKWNRRATRERAEPVRDCDYCGAALVCAYDRHHKAFAPIAPDAPTRQRETSGWQKAGFDADHLLGIKREKQSEGDTASEAPGPGQSTPP
jgi:hypothetical protein